MTRRYIVVRRERCKGIRCAVGVPRDPGDERVREAAANLWAGALLTFSRRDFGSAPLRFRVDVLTEAVRRIKG
jgi:hypothetical protein